mgnify:CR=1 FL=1|tara:strand:+ start:493 stop:684 length:192 start_codon:yes stop_codon:yes gene_type:complete
MNKLSILQLENIHKLKEEIQSLKLLVGQLLSVEVREDSEEFKTLEKDYGFTKVKFDEDGERYE